MQDRWCLYEMLCSSVRTGRSRYCVTWVTRLQVDLFQPGTRIFIDHGGHSAAIVSSGRKRETPRNEATAKEGRNYNKEVSNYDTGHNLSFGKIGGVTAPSFLQSIARPATAATA